MKTRAGLRDTAIAVVALIVVLAIPYLQRSPAFEDFIIRLSAMALFASSLNLLVGNAGMVSFEVQIGRRDGAGEILQRCERNAGDLADGSAFWRHERRSGTHGRRRRAWCLGGIGGSDRRKWGGRRAG